MLIPSGLGGCSRRRDSQKFTSESAIQLVWISEATSQGCREDQRRKSSLEEGWAQSDSLNLCWVCQYSVSLSRDVHMCDVKSTALLKWKMESCSYHWGLRAPFHSLLSFLVFFYFYFSGPTYQEVICVLKRWGGPPELIVPQGREQWLWGSSGGLDPLQTVVPSTRNEELAGTPFYVRDNDVLKLNDPYMSITTQDFRPFTE